MLQYRLGNRRHLARRTDLSDANNVTVLLCLGLTMLSPELT